MQFWTSKRQKLGGKVSSWPPGSVIFAKEILMIPLFLHNVEVKSLCVCALIDFIGSGFGHRMAAMDDTRS